MSAATVPAGADAAPAVRAELPPLPKRMTKLPVDRRGYPVPWFVRWADGVPDFRVIGAGKIGVAVRQRRCWICGEPLGAMAAFVAGPMCAVNRISGEPPSHFDCARFAAQACPFLVRPHMHRREGGLPEAVSDLPGTMLRRNPGVALVWVTRSYTVVRADGGALFRMGRPHAVYFFAEGRPATPAEVVESVRTGLPTLLALARRDGDGAVRALGDQLRAALPVLGLSLRAVTMTDAGAAA